MQKGFGKQHVRYGRAVRRRSMVCRAFIHAYRIMATIIDHDGHNHWLVDGTPHCNVKTTWQSLQWLNSTQQEKWHCKRNVRQDGEKNVKREEEGVGSFFSSHFSRLLLVHKYSILITRT